MKLLSEPFEEGLHTAQTLLASVSSVPMDPGLDAVFVILVVAGVFLSLIFTRAPVDVVMLSALAVLVALPLPDTLDGGWKIGILSTEEALEGYSNSGLATIAALFVVVAGLRASGAIDLIAGRILGTPSSLQGALVRIFGPVAFFSTFLNNTPVVAMMIPAINDWSKKIGLAPSKLLIPLSYAAILGGTCSLIGTSTNLIVSGLAFAQGVVPEQMGIFSISLIGVPVAVIGGAILLILAPILLPDRRSASEALQDPLEYTLEMKVPDGSPLHGKTVEESGIGNGCYLVEIEREGKILPAVGPRHRLMVNDRLVFAGDVQAVHDLTKQRGLIPATDQIFKLDSPRHRRLMFEAVLSAQSSLVGKTVKKGKFRNNYDGVVLAVARGAERVPGDIGNIPLEPGDVLLIEAPGSFETRNRGTQDFLMIKPLADSTPVRHEHAVFSIIILLAIVLVAAFGVVDMFRAAFAGAALMLVLRCCSTSEARSSVEWSVLLVIGAALGIGAALQKTGVDLLIANIFLSLGAGNPWYTLIGIYVATSFLTELITNNAAVALLFPIAIASANQLGVRVEPFLFGLMMAGSASFATPLGYQTNLMVYGPGGYTFSDFLKIGVIMNVTIGAATVILLPFIWPF